jgi:hypothetical protein
MDDEGFFAMSKHLAVFLVLIILIVMYLINRLHPHL